MLISMRLGFMVHQPPAIRIPGRIGPSLDLRATVLRQDLGRQYPLGLYASRVSVGSVRSTGDEVVGAVKAKLVMLRPALA